MADQIVTEEWRPVPGYEGRYEVSSLGRVKSIARRLHKKPNMNENGYWRVTLCKNNNGRSFFVHRLVLLAFCGVEPDGYEASHLNGVRSDCRLVNLEWTSRKANHAMKHVHDTAQIGERANCSKLKEADVRLIHSAYENGESKTSIANRFGVDRSAIYQALKGKTWRHAYPTRSACDDAILQAVAAHEKGKVTT